MDPNQRVWRDYGNFYIVAFGVSVVLFGFLATLFRLEAFEDLSQAEAFMTALFGAVAGLVGTYFGVKTSADAVDKVLASGGDGIPPTVSLTPTEARAALNTEHSVNAVVTSADGSRACGVPIVFRVTGGPGTSRETTTTTDDAGSATFTIPNNGNGGTDTIEATCLQGTGTATVRFTRFKRGRGG